MRYCGMDVSDKSSTVCVINKEGSVIHRGNVFTDPDGLRKYFGREERMQVGIEAGGTSAHLAKVIASYGHDVKVLDPKTIKALTNGKKTDRKDAESLAKVLHIGWYCEVYQKSDSARLLRTLIGARGNLVDMHTRLVNEIQGYMKHWGLPVGSSNKAKFYERVYSRLEGFPELGLIIKPLMEVLIGVETQLDILDKQVVNASKESESAKIAMSHPGVGPVVAMSYIATIDNPLRFKKSRQVGSYAGLVSRVFQSGEVETHGRITKNGDAKLRGYLIAAAHSLLTGSRSNCKLKAWGLRLAKKKGYSKAKIAVARRIAVNLHHMLVNREMFDYAVS